MSRTLIPLIFGIAGTAVLLSLGIWQMQRLAWKDAILSEIDARITATPVALPVLADPEFDRFLPVIVSGSFVGPEVHVLVSVKQVGAGYRILQSFETEGRKVIVDRGFIRTEAKAELRPTGPFTVTGNLHWPQEIDGFTPKNDLVENIWFSRDVPTLAAHLGTEPMLIIARAFTQTDPSVSPLPVDSGTIPNDHLNYAITWFALAAIWVGMTGYFLYRQRRQLTD